MSGFSVQRATADDAGLMADLTRTCWAGKVSPGSSGHRETAHKVAQQLRAGGGFVLLQQGVAVGSVRWLPLDGAPDVWEILRMGLLPAVRGHKRSDHLLAAVAEAARAAAVTELRLAVRHDQPRLLDFYAAHGFVMAAELAYNHANPLEPAPPMMRRRLCP